jgi:predicted aldo/keto reductase-like oxidoreductase
MRFKDRPTAVETIRRAIDAGFNYFDSAPVYCYHDERENSESWLGEALDHPRYRGRALVSAKCSGSNGGWELGEFNGETGFGVRTSGQLRQVFEQSCRRLKVPRFDYYHLWATHTEEQFQEAFKPGGWHEGVLSLKARWDHLGLTTHADSDTIIRFLKTNRFELVTVPFNVVNTTRLRAVEYCRRKGIAVIAMNPLAGGFLAAHPRLKELAFRYLLAFENVRLLIGFSSPAEVDYAKKILDDAAGDKRPAEEILAEAAALIDAREPRCTACGYCLPCPQNINVGACLGYYNAFKYLNIDEAKREFNEKKNWDDSLRIDRCVQCGQCASRCPNHLPAVDLLTEARRVLYE